MWGKLQLRTCCDSPGGSADQRFRFLRSYFRFVSFFHFLYVFLSLCIVLHYENEGLLNAGRCRNAVSGYRFRCARTWGTISHGCPIYWVTWPSRRPPRRCTSSYHSYRSAARACWSSFFAPSMRRCVPNRSRRSSSFYRADPCAKRLVRNFCQKFMSFLSLCTHFTSSEFGDFRTWVFSLFCWYIASWMKLK